jgi:hypothetical protein
MSGWELLKMDEEALVGSAFGVTAEYIGISNSFRSNFKIRASDAVSIFNTSL